MSITGYFTEVKIPEVPVGSDIEATIGFYALNPGALYWKTFLIADSFQVGRKELDATREMGQEGGRTKTYSLGTMPDKTVGITIRIFAHDEAGYDWDWTQFQAWLKGYSVEFTHLDTHLVFLEPSAEKKPPPEVADITGTILGLEPNSIPYGSPLDISIDFNAYNDSLYYQVRGWETKVTTTLDSLRDSDVQEHYGRDGSRTGQTLHLGTMPDRDLIGKVVLEGRPLKIPAAPWDTLDSVSFSIQSTARDREPVPPPPPPEPPPEVCSTDADCPEGYECRNGKCVKKEEKVAWWAWLIPAGLAVVALSGRKPKKKRE